MPLPACTRKPTLARHLFRFRSAVLLLLSAPSAVYLDAQSAAPLTLDTVLALAAQQHPLLDAARARVTAARGVRGTAGALPNPVFNYWTESAPFPFQSPRAGLDRETQTYANIPLEFLYQRASGVRGADAGVAAATADLARAQQTVSLEAARAFYRVAEAQVRVDAMLDVRARLVELVTYNELRVREGRTAEVDLIRTQVELDRVDASVALNAVELTRAQATLTPYLGANRFRVDSLRVAIDASAASPSALVSLDALLAIARGARQDLIAARARVTAAQASTGLQRALTLRTLNATFGSKRTLGVTSMIAGFTVPLPIFDRNRGAIQEATGLQQATAADLAWVERRVDAEVQSAYAAATSLAAQTSRLRGRMLERAEESRRIALAAYQEGAVSLLQVLDASRTLADARLAYYRLLFAERESQLELRAAIGETSLSAPLKSDASSGPASADTSPTFSPRSSRQIGVRP
jgi:outer membrane protein, heavy metal efflux system